MSMTLDLTLNLLLPEELDMPEAQKLLVLFCLNAILETIVDHSLTGGFPQEAQCQTGLGDSSAPLKSLPFDQAAADNEAP